MDTQRDRDGKSEREETVEKGGREKGPGGGYIVGRGEFGEARGIARGWFIGPSQFS